MIACFKDHSMSVNFAFLKILNSTLLKIFEWSKFAQNLKWNFSWIFKWMFLEILWWQNMVKSFLNRFHRIIACEKGLESGNPDALQVITSCKVLHVITYKIENTVEKSPRITWNIAWLHQVVYMYGKRRVQGSQWWQPKL
jgi:hypothetical protein